MIIHRLARAFAFPLLFLLPFFHPASGNPVSTEFLTRNAARMNALFLQLDVNHPVTGPLVDLWNTGKKAEAAEQLVAYFEGKSFPVELLETPSYPVNLEEQAMAALENRFFILDNWERIPTLADGNLDWSYRGKGQDKEVAWMLNRHAFLPVLERAYQEFGDNSYRICLNGLVSGWITSNPYPGGLSFSPAWRPLEVARRILNSWTCLFYGRDILDPETRLLVLSSIPEHADSLHNHASFWGGNHLISEKLALLTMAHAWPEFSDSETWKDEAIKELSDQFMRQTYQDGSYKELSNHYQRVVLVNAQLFMRLLAAADPGYASRPVASRITQMWNFFAWSMRPDGYGPLNNASDLEANATFVHDIWDLYNRPDWLYMATNGARGERPPLSSSAFFPWAGQVFIRNNWTREADWLYFDAGPYGTAHQHVDRMHLSAMLDGRPVLVDGGRFTYKPGFWTSYFKGPDSHNILKLDGQPSRQLSREILQPVSLQFQEGEGFVFTGAVCQFPGGKTSSILPPLKSPVPWTRSILYDKRGFALVLDHIVTFNKHRLEAIWNFDPDITPSEADNVLRPVAGSEDFQILTKEGFHSPDYNRKVSAVRRVHKGTISRPTTLAWLLQDTGTPPVNLEITSNPGDKLIHGRLLQEGISIAEFSVRVFPEPELVDYTTQ